eukprot:SM000003S11210  [mRNA]  locus=s3:1490564:1494949:- [translate_table: standard]
MELPRPRSTATSRTRSGSAAAALCASASSRRSSSRRASSGPRFSPLPSPPAGLAHICHCRPRLTVRGGGGGGRLWRAEGGGAGCRVRWYMLPEEAHCGRQRHHGARELFLSVVEDDIQVASIVRRCHVLPLAAFRAAADGGDDVYFCEYEYDAAWHRFSRLPAEADGGDRGASGSSSGSDFDGGGGSYSSPSEDDGGGAMVRKRRRRRQLDGRAATKKRGSGRRAAVTPSLKAAVTPGLGHALQNLRRHRHAGGARVGSAEIPAAARQPLHDPFDRACAALALAAAPKSLPCRERERAAIEAFLEEAIADGGTHCLGRSLYVSGVPGTGKRALQTATVMGVLRNMARRAAASELPPFQLADINGLRLPSPQHLYSVLYEGLTGQRVSHKVALKQLESMFAGGGGGGSSGAASQRQQRQRRPCILLVDELDLLMTKKQTVLYNLFNWPTLPGSQLVVVGIANTMDLPERLLPRILSRLGLTRVAFTPYTRQQLQAIVAARLQESPVFDAQAVELASRKVSSRAWPSCGSERVGMADIDVAIRETFQAPHMLVGGLSTLAPNRTVACLTVDMDNQQEKVFLASLVLEGRRSGVAEATLERVAGAHLQLCRAHGEAVPPLDTLCAIGCRLGVCRLILCEPGTKRRHQKLQLNVPSDDVAFVLKKDDAVPWLARLL